MLRTEKSHQLNPFRIEEDVNRGVQIAVNPARIGHQSDPFALKDIEAVLPEHLHSGFHPCVKPERQKQDGKRQTYQIEFIFFHIQVQF